MFVQCKNNKGQDKTLFYNYYDLQITAAESVTASYKSFESQS